MDPTDLVKAAGSKWTSTIPIVKVPAINITAHRDPDSVIAYTSNQHCNFQGELTTDIMELFCWTARQDAQRTQTMINCSRFKRQHN